MDKFFVFKFAYTLFILKKYLSNNTKGGSAMKDIVTNNSKTLTV